MRNVRKMVKENKYISIYMRNSRWNPSDYYRITQYLEDLHYSYIIHNSISDSLFNLNINTKNKFFKKLVQAICYLMILIRRCYAMVYDLRNNPKVIVVQREIFPRKILPIGRILLKRMLANSYVIWDFDDDIFEGEISKDEAGILCDCSDKIIVIGEYLKSLLPEAVQNKVLTMPTTDKPLNSEGLAKCLKYRKNIYTNEIHIVWVGTSGNLPSLKMISNDIEKSAVLLKKLGKRIVLTVVCNRPLIVSHKDYLLRNIKWTREMAQLEMQKAHIGIMPLLNTKFALGKGGFKLIQYMSNGLPVIGSNIGFNKEVINNGVNGFLIEDNSEGVWTKRIVEMATNFETWENMSNSSFQRYQNQFSYEKNLKMWGQILNSFHHF